MNMNAKRWSCGLLCSWLLTLAPAPLQAADWSHALQLANAAVTQSATSGSRREADDLLRQARAAMKEGNLKLARWCLDRVEQMEVSYDGLFQRFGDTPQKVRRDLAVLEKGGSSAAEGTDPQEAIVDSEANSPPPSSSVPAGVPAPSRAAPGQMIRNPYVAAAPPNSATSPSAPAPAPVRPADSPQKIQATQLLARARVALDRGQIDEAQQLAQQAHALQVPDHEFGPGQPRPWMLLLAVDRARRVAQASALTATSTETEVVQAGGPPPLGTRVQPAAAQQLLPPPRLAQASPGESFSADINAVPEGPQPDPFDVAPTSNAEEPIAAPAGELNSGYDLLERGEAAVKQRDFEKARELFRDAWKYEAELDPSARQRLQDHLQLLRVTDVPPSRPEPTLTEGEAALVRRFATEISQQQTAIRRLVESEPKNAWQQLKDLRQKVVDAEVPDEARRQLLARVDRSIQDTEAYIERNRGRIELDERNRSVVEEIDRRRLHQIEIDDELASMVDEFNQLMDQERFSEAVVLAKKARELSPNNPTVESMVWKSRFAERLMVEMSIRDRSQIGVEGALTSVMESGIPFDDRIAIEFPAGGSAKYWEELTGLRRRAMGEGGRQFTETELEIQRALKKKVQVDFTDQPLSQVLSQLGDLVGVSIYLDPQGLAAEGATSDVPVTIHLNQELQLKSALNIILEQYGLSYVIQDEVLKITSESVRDSKTYVDTYDVADLVIPIPNFVSSYNVGLPSAIREAYNSQGWNGFQGGYNQAPLTVLANNNHSVDTPQSVLAQMANTGSLPGNAATATTRVRPRWSRRWCAGRLRHVDRIDHRDNCSRHLG